ncbi:MAG: hypothetical protein Q4B80_03555 [Aerococcaceae bacterium]|nr:hypothetical protein [Aerococcaceae bacterium]
MIEKGMLLIFVAIVVGILCVLFKNKRITLDWLSNNVIGIATVFTTICIALVGYQWQRSTEEYNRLIQEDNRAQAKANQVQAEAEKRREDYFSDPFVVNVVPTDKVEEIEVNGEEEYTVKSKRLQIQQIHGAVKSVDYILMTSDTEITTNTTDFSYQLSSDSESKEIALEIVGTLSERIRSEKGKSAFANHYLLVESFTGSKQLFLVAYTIDLTNKEVTDIEVFDKTDLLVHKNSSKMLINNTLYDVEDTLTATGEGSTEEERLTEFRNDLLAKGIKHELTNYEHLLNTFGLLEE